MTDQQQYPGPTWQYQGVLPDGSARYQATFMIQPTGRVNGLLAIEDNDEHESNERFHLTHRQCTEMSAFINALEYYSGVTSIIPLPTFGPEEIGRETRISKLGRGYVRSTSVAPIVWGTPKEQPAPDYETPPFIMGGGSIMDLINSLKERSDQQREGNGEPGSTDDN